MMTGAWLLATWLGAVRGLFAGTVDGDTISGVVEFEGAGQGSWHATRTASKK
jgi:hypothetical protein